MQRLTLLLVFAAAGISGCRSMGECAQSDRRPAETGSTQMAVSPPASPKAPHVQVADTETQRQILPVVASSDALTMSQQIVDGDFRCALDGREARTAVDSERGAPSGFMVEAGEPTIEPCGFDTECTEFMPAVDCDADACLPLLAAQEFDFHAGDDLRAFGPTLWRDTRGLIQPENLTILGISLAAAIGIRPDLDDQVRRETAAHPLRWGDASRFLGHMGEAPYQVPVLGACWGYSLWTDDPELHDLMSTVVSAYTISGLATLAIKGVSDTDRPDADWNGGHWGFPSYHAASSFTIAAVLDEYYGWGVGLPAYTLAGLIGWSRIDERDHDLSDVVFGAAMGWVIGKSVAGTHLRGDGRVHIGPWTHPTEGGSGVMFETRF